MLLAIDVGNTNTVIGLFEGDRMSRSWRTKTDARTTADESPCAQPFLQCCARCA